MIDGLFGIIEAIFSGVVGVFEAGFDGIGGVFGAIETSSESLSS
ncbi:hypothetical protein [Corynebacterium guangdongense]|uniref:Phage-related protein n=1 Tax=Corynebacterium guangdongense TaxID=1783348 RepID=A0ABU2A307_9CORY|nr:hypothetical protein [Corynebacterium guangdongense]MDR7330882.1 phage-related protein [Corynebacterium guangdongense]WJZ16897.1 hypothetical protein CGUA_01485 [Corynebacterium guangdongense]